MKRTVLNRRYKAIFYLLNTLIDSLGLSRKLFNDDGNADERDLRSKMNSQVWVLRGDLDKLFQRLMARQSQQEIKTEVHKAKRGEKLKEKRPTVIFDIGGTLADTTHRKHLCKQKDVAEVCEQIANDKPKHNIIKLFEMHHHFGDYIILLTGRSEQYREATQRWIINHCAGFDALMMRKDDDGRPGEIVKADIYRKLIEPYHNVWQVYDDKTYIVNMWRELGLECAQVAPGGF